jgi:hypothetical protein
VPEALIVCPTHGRAGDVKVLEVIPDIPLCVAKSQEPLYREAHPGSELIVHPDEIVGISPKRQWLVDRFGDVFMFDDDVTAVTDVQVGLNESAKVRDPQRIRDVVQALFDLAEGLGAHVLGLNTYADPVMYRPHRPFSLKHMVSGHCLGIRRDPRLRFPDLPDLLTDDLYISALAAYHDRIVLTDMRYAASVAHTWRATGGMAAHRTWQRVVDNEKFMVTAFGDAIRRRQESARSSLQVEIQLTMHVPW